MKRLLMMALCMGQIATMKAPYVEDKERDTTAPRDDTREKPSLFRRLGDFLTGKKPTQKAPAKITAQQAPSKSQVSGDEAQAPVEAPVVDAAEESRLRELEPKRLSFEKHEEAEIKPETPAERDARVEKEVQRITKELDELTADYNKVTEELSEAEVSAINYGPDNENMNNLKRRKAEIDNSLKEIYKIQEVVNPGASFDAGMHR